MLPLHLADSWSSPEVLPASISPQHFRVSFDKTTEEWEPPLVWLHDQCCCYSKRQFAGIRCHPHRTTNDSVLPFLLISARRWTQLEDPPDLGEDPEDPDHDWSIPLSVLYRIWISTFRSWFHNLTVWSLFKNGNEARFLQWIKMVIEFFIDMREWMHILSWKACNFNTLMYSMYIYMHTYIWYF